MPFHHSVRNFQEVPVAENEIVWQPGDLDTRKRTGTSWQIEIHFPTERTEYLP